MKINFFHTSVPFLYNHFRKLFSFYPYGSAISCICLLISRIAYPIKTFFPSNANPYLRIRSGSIPFASRTSTYLFSSI